MTPPDGAPADPADRTEVEPLGTARFALYGTSLQVPAGWRVDRDEPPYTLVAVEPRDDAFAANLAVVREPAEDGDPFSTPGRLEQWIGSLAEGLEGFHLVDIEAEVIAQEPGLRLLFLHHTTQRGLACEQWVRPDAEGTTIVALTCLALDRDHFGPMFAAVAASWVADDA